VAPHRFRGRCAAGGRRQQARRLRVVGEPVGADYPETHLVRKFGLPPQPLPEAFYQQEFESTAQFRDRLYHTFRIPVNLAALSQIKCAYVEVENPLLSAEVIHTVRAMPDELRTEKAAFTRIVDSLGPDVPYATGAALMSAREYIATSEFVEELVEELSSSHARSVLEADALDAVIRAVTAVGNSETREVPPAQRLRRAVRRLLPPGTLNALRPFAGPTPLNPEVVAFRAYLISRMVELLRSDAAESERG
jgi:hypothetical protein